MKAKTYFQKLIQSLRNRQDIKIEKYKLKYKNGKFDFLKILSKKIGPKDRIVLISAGFHGEEKAGSLTILKYANEIIEYIHKNNLKVIIYPLINPSGFEKGKRFNIDNDEGSAGNNDFLRYELANGDVIDDLGQKRKFKRWYWSSDFPAAQLPKETKLLHRLLRSDSFFRIVAAIDLHQDYITGNIPSAAYHYSFGKLGVYKNIIKKIEKILPLLKNKKINAGFENPQNNPLWKTPVGEGIKSNNQGFIVRHDGSITDLMHRIGVKYSIAVETTGKTPLSVARQVNLIWIFGIVDLVKSGR